MIPLGLTAAATATDPANHNKIFDRYNKINNFEWRNEWCHENSYFLEESGLLMKGVSETIKNEAKEQKGGFLSLLLGPLGACLLLNFLTGKRTVRACEGTIRAGQEI